MCRPSDPEAFLPLSPHHTEILLSLAERDLHGYRIIQDIRERTSGAITLGTGALYAAIKRLVENGLVEDVGDRPSEGSGGPPRRYYKVSELGRKVGRLEAQRLKQVARVAGRRFGTAAKAPAAE